MIILGAHGHSIDHPSGTVALTMPLGIGQGACEIGITQRIGWRAHGALLVLGRIRRRLNDVHVLNQIRRGCSLLLHVRLQCSDG